jgi:hypothetical protein
MPSLSLPTVAAPNPMAPIKPATPGPDVKSTAAFPSPRVGPAIGVDALSGRWRGDSGMCGMITEMTIEAKHFDGWVTFFQSSTVAKFSGTIEDDGTINITPSDPHSLVNISGQLPQLRINKAVDYGANGSPLFTKQTCTGASMLFKKITP